MGFWSTEEEVVGLQSVELLKGNRVNPVGQDPYSLANQEAIAHTMVNNPNNMHAYRAEYMVGFRRKYREAYSYQRLSSLGFAPESAPVEKTDIGEYLTWVQGSTNPFADVGLALSVGAITPTAEARLYLQTTYGTAWTNNNNALLNSNINGLVGNWTLDKAINIIDDFGGGDYVEIYMTGTSGQGNAIITTNYVIAPPTSVHVLQYTNNATGSNWYLDRKESSTVPPGMVETIQFDISPIVPVKENNIMNTEERDCINVMDELGVGGQELWDNLILACPDSYVPPENEPNKDCDEGTKVPSTIDNAYVFTGIYPNTDDSGVYAGLFMWFDTFVGISGGSFNLKIQALRTEYSFSAYKTIKSGVIGHRNEYTKIISGGVDGPVAGSPDDELTLQWQVTEDTYEEIVVSAFQQRWTITREGKDWNFFSNLSFDPDDHGENEAQARLILPLDLYNNMPYDAWVPVHETGMVMLAYTHEVIKLKWWQTGIFKIIIIVLVTIYSVGTGTAFITAIINTVVNAVIAMAIGAIANVLASLTDIEFLQVIIFAIAAVATIYFAGDINKLTGFDGYYKMANIAMESYNKAENLQMATFMAEAEDKLSELEKEQEELDELVKSLKGVNAAIYIQDYDMDLSSMSPGGMQSPDQYFAEKQGSSMYNFDSLFDIDAVYSQKKNVKV